ncbi:MAG: class I SAM-dependent methyltransferase [Planctomycetota bacterium]
MPTPSIPHLGGDAKHSLVCPACDANASSDRPLRGYPTAICCQCEHRFVTQLATPSQITQHVEATYGDEYFQGGGAGYADYAAEAALLRRHGQRYGHRLARHVTPGRLLDVGAAAGFLMEGYHEAGWHCVGVEPNATMAADGQSRGIDVRHAMFEHFTMSTDEPLFDAVAMVQVLPHFMEPAAALDVARAVTRPGGLWLIETWNRRSVVARLRGEHWHEYSPPSVLHWFTHQSLDALVGRFGGVRIERGRSRKRIAASHAKSLLRERGRDSAVDRALYGILRLIPERLTLPYPGDDLFFSIYRFNG